MALSQNGSEVGKDRRGVAWLAVFPMSFQGEILNGPGVQPVHQNPTSIASSCWTGQLCYFVCFFFQESSVDDEESSRTDWAPDWNVKSTTGPVAGQEKRKRDKISTRPSGQTKKRKRDKKQNDIRDNEKTVKD